MPIRVFISHSTNQTENKPFLKDLCQRLKAETKAGQSVFEVFVDTQINTGESWRVKLLNWISKCQAGIVLLNKKAITMSDWVHTEATLLRWRQWLDGDVMLILVLLGQDTQQLFDKTTKWHPLSFGDIQFLKGDNGLEFTAPTIDTTAYEKMVAHLKQSKKIKTSFDKLRVGLQTSLESAFKDSCIDGKKIETLVNTLLIEGPKQIDPLINEYSMSFACKPAPIKIALDLIAPWWVNPVASCPLCMPINRSQTHNAYCLNSSNPQYYRYTSMMYIRHAVCLAPQFSKKRMVFVQGNSGYQDIQKHIEEVMNEVTSGLKNLIGKQRIEDLLYAVPDKRELDADIHREINEWLERKIEKRQPIFIVLPPHITVNTKLINKIFSTYPLVKLLLIMESKEAALKIKHAKQLKPFLDPIEEQREYNCYHDAKAYFD
ncbi:MAG: toll/interleukin-1 receptor domain-containing protein [Desulfobacteraceae bacterium]|jgi:hypothetical protein